MALALSPELEARIRAQAADAGITVETYLQRIADAEEDADKELETLALEGLNSGDSVEASESWWAERRQSLRDLSSKPR